MHAWCPPRPGKCIGSLGTRVLECCEWELNPGPWQEYPELLTDEPSL